MTSKISRRNFSVSLLGLSLAAPVASAWGQVFSSKKSTPGRPGQQPISSPVQPPTSRYRITYFPYRGAELKEPPVLVFNVGGQAMKESITRQFSVKNNSDKAVKEIQISLRVMVDKHAVMPILNEVNSRHVFNSVLLPQAEHLFKGEDKVKDLCGSLFVDGHLNGAYRVEVLVSKVWFEDGSRWEAQEPNA